MLAWVLSALTIVNIYLMGNKSLWGPRLGFFGQGLWITFAVTTRQYGLLPCCIALAIVYARNWRKWAMEQRGEEVIVWDRGELTRRS